MQVASCDHRRAAPFAARYSSKRQCVLFFEQLFLFSLFRVGIGTRADRFWFSWQCLHRRAADVADEYAFGGMPTGGMGPEDEEAERDERLIAAARLRRVREEEELRAVDVLDGEGGEGEGEGEIVDLDAGGGGAGGTEGGEDAAAAAAAPAAGDPDGDESA